MKLEQMGEELETIKTMPIHTKDGTKVIGKMEVKRLKASYFQVYFGYINSGHLVGYSRNLRTMEQRVRLYVTKSEAKNV